MKITNRDIWESMKMGRVENILIIDSSPNFQKWAKTHINSFEEMFDIIKNVYQLTYQQYINEYEPKEKNITKIETLGENFYPVLLKILEGENIDNLIWDKIEPEIILTYKK